ncbi:MULTISPECIES: penicillin-binding protein PBP4(5) [Enterococcus]|uniref:Penicillin-binding protein transpeptidase n=1 Tax=Enterococcus sulfureus ATCC 49903 TaxID=1140003 RepID=S0P4N8_9ENTE|nr:penicillin-binding transpeptidase domain-containing protein [Enterococcus sulfureus]EOT46922.1 hypothetical protein OMY_01172 [Enterococcus sulfureus ATCC 49903]EOT83783.1 hypothetical protein I573_01508 [Enterococcus sulfureus ATCC 49903]
MKTKYLVWGVAGIVVGIGLSGTVWYYQNHQAQVKATEIVTDFTNALSQQKFTELNQYVSTDSLKAEGFTKEELAKKYETIYQGIGVKEAKIKEIETKKQKKGYEVSYELTLTTALGKYTTTYQAMVDADKIQWTPALIFPDMTKDDTVSYQPISATRGQIVDRNQQGLAINDTLDQVGIIPGQLGEQKENAIAQIAALYGLTSEGINQTLAQGWVTDDAFVPLKVTKDAPNENLPGVEIRQTTGRYYPLGEAAAQLIGYTGEVTAEDLEKNPKLEAGQLIGRSGLEQTLDDTLRGQDGGEIVLLDQNQQEKKVLVKKQVTNGKDVTLTLDANAQKIAFEHLGGKKGSSVATLPKTGDLVALVSSPSYDPNKMANGISSAEYNVYAENEAKPFISRFATRYAPGSTFKTITAALGIDAKTLDPDQKIAIPSLKWQKDASWGDYQVTRVQQTDEVNLKDALMYSDNIYFAQQTLKMGEATFREGLNRFIFGETLDLPFEMKAAQISNDEQFNSEILLADTGYGQGQLLISPVEQATMYSVFANEGNLVYPRLLLDAQTKTKNEVISQEAVKIVGSDLRAVVTEPTAFGYRLNALGIDVAAKTGTAEIKQSQDDTSGTENSFLFAYDYGNHNYLTVTMFEDSQGEYTAIKQADELLSYLNQTYQ